MAQDDTGLAQRGLLLLTMMTALVGVVLYIMFQTPAQELPVETRNPAAEVAGLVVPTTSYPAAVAWPALVRLSDDLPSPEGWRIRYNAANTLARLGSDRLPWPVMREMLDEGRQMRNYRVHLADGKEVPDEVAARTGVMIALKALAEWHQKQKAAGKTAAPAGARDVYAQVDALAASPYPELRAQAEKTRGTLFRPTTATP